MRYAIQRSFRRARCFETLEYRNMCAVDLAETSQLAAEELMDLGIAAVLESQTAQYAAATTSFDVNHDGLLTVADAEAVVNSLNQGGPRPVRSSDGEGEPATAHLDVDHDGYLAPIDALRHE